MPVCVISQPRLFPGLHYLHRMMVADVFVIFDTVQFNPRHEENRTKVKTAGGPKWITAPMRHVSRDQLIVETRLDAAQDWHRAASRTLEMSYGKAPHYTSHASEVMEILAQPHETLTSLTRASWGPALRILDVRCRFVLASELPVSGKGPRLLLDICKNVGADGYLSGGFGKEYLDVEEFKAEGVSVAFHEYQYPVYPQLHGEFVPFLSYLDALFNVGLQREFVSKGAGGATCEAAPDR